MTQAEAATSILPLDDEASLAGVFQQRLSLTPEALAYRYFDPDAEQWIDLSWADAGRQVARWRAALQAEGLARGERVAMMLGNSVEWAFFDLAAQSLGLVTVPLYTNDRLENVAYILDHSGARLLLIGERIELSAEDLHERVAGLQRIVVAGRPAAADSRALPLAEWLPETGPALELAPVGPNSLATIVYTSGTTGRPKGVMLSQRNILWDIHAGLGSIKIYPHDLFLSFLPMSHALERSIGFYLPMVAGAGVAFARSIALLAQDLQQVRPTVMIAVPRIFERIYGKLWDKIGDKPSLKRMLFTQAISIGWKRFEVLQGRRRPSPSIKLWPLYDRLVARKIKERFGGRLRFAVCGGAALSTEVAKLFIGLDICIAQGYGLTESSPVVSVNRLEDNLPESVGPALPGIEARIGEQDELLTRSPSVMLGYWRDEQATAEVIDAQGWLHTGDKASMEGKHILITGRLKEIIVLANGEKVAPGDIEMAISLDPLIEQALVIGEGKPFLSAILAPEPEAFAQFLNKHRLPPDATAEHPQLQQLLLARIAKRLLKFPGHIKIRRVCLTSEPWRVDNGMMTPTMKLRRGKILAQHSRVIDHLYTGH